jgi:hypothetical protein
MLISITLLNQYSIKKNIHKARIIKLADKSVYLKNFTYFKKNINNLSKNQYTLLFLNQGLSSHNLSQLRFNLKPFGICLSQLPIRF